MKTIALAVSMMLLLFFAATGCTTNNRTTIVQVQPAASTPGVAAAVSAPVRQAVAPTAGARRIDGVIAPVGPARILHLRRAGRSGDDEELETVLDERPVVAPSEAHTQVDIDGE